MRKGSTSVVIAGLLTALFTAPWVLVSVAGAADKPAEQEESKKGSTRIKDAPEPIPQVMDKLREVGNEVGKGITKAASEGASAVKKAVKGNKEKDKEK